VTATRMTLICRLERQFGARGQGTFAGTLAGAEPKQDTHAYLQLGWANTSRR
jgi:hypothetical protein